MDLFSSFTNQLNQQNTSISTNNNISNNTNTLTQEQNLAKLNELLTTSSQQLLCGPGTECNRTNTENQLKQNYLNAETNLKSAPYQLDYAEKQYYTFTKGATGYNDILDKKLMTKVDELTKKMQDEFQKGIKNAIRFNDTLKTSTINYEHITELYEDYVDKNKELQQKIKTLGGDIVTNDRKTFYENQNYDILLWWYNVWKWIYILLVVTFIIGLFLTKSICSNWTKFGFLILFIVYPFVINYIVLGFLKLIVGINSLLPKNVYTSL